MAAGNVIFGGIIGLGVDAASGAMNKYPDVVHCRDDAGSGMPRPGTGPAQPGTAAAHLGAVVFRADPRARGGAGTFSGWRW